MSPPLGYLSSKMTDPFKTWVNRDSHIIKSLGYNVQPSIFKPGHSDKPVSEVSRQTTRQMPKLEGKNFRFGNDPANQQYVIYVSLERSNDVLKVSLTSLLLTFSNIFQQSL